MNNFIVSPFLSVRVHFFFNHCVMFFPFVHFFYHCFMFFSLHIPFFLQLFQALFSSFTCLSLFHGFFSLFSFPVTTVSCLISSSFIFTFNTVYVSKILIFLLFSHLFYFILFRFPSFSFNYYFKLIFFNS